MPIIHRAYAKINLGLYITGKRPDGYHDILTVFHRINLFDEITFEKASTIEVTSTSAEAPGGETNLCHKAALALQQHLGISNGASIHITKNIPVGAGLGGGSSNAAVVLQQLPNLWGQTVAGPDLRRIALALGSDVPYFLGNKSALATGRGEELEYIPLDIPYTILLCNPNIHISTAWAYQQVRPAPAPTKQELGQVLQAGLSNPTWLYHTLRNDFEEPVFREFPMVQEVKQQMFDAGAVFALMSGSGSSVFGLFNDGLAARAVERAMQQRGYRTFLTEPHFHL